MFIVMDRVLSLNPHAELYHVTEVANVASILRDGLKARAGSWSGTSWKPRVFFATTRIGAYEIANNFIWERKGTYVIVRVDSAKVPGRLRQDLDYDQGVWIPANVPPEAITGFDEVDEEFFESDEFLGYMGCEPEDEEAPT